MTKRYEKPVLHGLSKYEVEAVKDGQVEIGGIAQLRHNKAGKWWLTGDTDRVCLDGAYLGPVHFGGRSLDIEIRDRNYAHNLRLTPLDLQGDNCVTGIFVGDGVTVSDVSLEWRTSMAGEWDMGESDNER